MNENIVITICREYGSGGRAIGRLLAAELGIEFYDRDYINSLASQKLKTEQGPYSGMEGILGLPAKGDSGKPYDLVLENIGHNDKSFEAQTEVIWSLASNSSCVIVGRCAEHILHNMPNRMSVFIHAEPDSRKRRVLTLNDIPEEMAEIEIGKIDRMRSTYYNYFTNRTWGDARNFDLCIDTTRIGTGEATRLLKNFVLDRFPDFVPLPDEQIESVNL